MQPAKRALTIAFGALNVLAAGSVVASAPVVGETQSPVELWGMLLQAHVDQSGLVDYQAFKQDVRFQKYLEYLGNTTPAEFGGDKARLAFWINAYNAFAIQGVLRTLPENPADWPAYRVLDVTVPGVKQAGKGFFLGLRFVVGKRDYTLDEIEQAVLLQRPAWLAKDATLYRSVGVGTPDARIHFALVCCAKGCPRLRREPYGASRIGPQLDDAIRLFVQDRSRVRFEQQSRVMHVSRLLDWYSKDLTDPRMLPGAASVAEFLSRYVGDGDLARSLAGDSWRTTYIEYDWQLNLQR